MEPNTQTEGTVDWAAAQDFLTGKAKEAEAAEGAPEGTTQATPEFVEVSIKGRKVRMTPDDAAVFEEFRRETRERDGRLGGEIAQSRERIARLEGALQTMQTKPAASSPELRPPDPKLATEDFAEWARQNDAYHAAKMAQLATDLEARYRAEQDQLQQASAESQRSSAWAQKFYKDNPELDTPRKRRIVQDVYNEHAAKVSAAGSVAEQHEVLAELVAAEITALASEGKTPTNKPPRLEGGSTPSAPRKTETPVQPVSAASWQAKKRALMRGGK